jgi:hypothetical protein
MKKSTLRSKQNKKDSWKILALKIHTYSHNLYTPFFIDFLNSNDASKVKIETSFILFS